MVFGGKDYSNNKGNEEIARNYIKFDYILPDVKFNFFTWQFMVLNTSLIVQ